jgi:hypothetical protein
MLFPLHSYRKEKNTDNKPPEEIPNTGDPILRGKIQLIYEPEIYRHAEQQKKHHAENPTTPTTSIQGRLILS